VGGHRRRFVLRGCRHASLSWRARAVGLAASGAALVGFVVGLSFTTLGGHVPDVASHVTLLPLFAATIIVLLRMGKGAMKPFARPPDSYH
jgi:hypothetical protein